MKGGRGNRILWIHPGGLLPIGGGGAARTWAIMDYLRARGYTLELITGNQGPQNEALEARVDRLWIENRYLTSGTRSPRAPIREGLKRCYKAVDPDLRMLHRFSSQAPKSTDMFTFNRRAPLERYAGEVAYADPPCAAFVSYAWLAPALDHMPPGVLRLIDTHDIQHERRAVAAAAGGDLSHINCSREAEIRELNRADVILAIQQGEQKKMQAMCPDREVLLAEHAYPVPDFVPSAVDAQNLLYVGNRYDPNILGLRAFLNKVWPPLRRLHPRVTLSVCGRVCEGFHGRFPGVTFHGHVPDLAPFYRQAAVVLNPVPYGTGLKIKTIEGLAFGRTVVTSEAGTCGLGAPSELPLIVTDSPESMTTHLARLLKSPEERHRQEIAAWEFAKHQFAPDRVYGALIDRLDLQRDLPRLPESARR